MNSQDKKWKVYRHINKINNKMYIGITSVSFKSRWRNGKGYNICPLFYKAINKYGWNNFKHEVLTKNGWIEYIDENIDNLLYFNKKEVEQKEIELIKEFKTYLQENGYNLSKGGNLASQTRCKKVYQYSKEGKLIKKWESIIDVQNKLKYSQSPISQCCLGKRKTAYGFLWSFKELTIEDINIILTSKNIFLTTLQMNNNT